MLAFLPPSANAEVRAATFIPSILDSAFNSSSARPSQKYAFSGSVLMLANGSTAIVCVAWTCSAPPDDRARWTMQLLADKLVELKVVETISDETVRRTLKKTI